MAKLIVITGSRIINKRISLFLKSFFSRGYKCYILALPRRSWCYSTYIPFKKKGFFLCEISNNRCLEGINDDTIIMCFHWALLPIAYLFKLITKGKLIYDDFDFYLLNTQELGKYWIKKIKKIFVTIFEKIFLSKVDLITCIKLRENVLRKHLSKYNKNVLEINNYPISKILDINLYNKECSHEIAVCYIGGVYKVKGLDLIIESAKLLANIPNVKISFHIFGEGEISSLSSNPFLNFYGHRDMTEIINILNGKRCIGLLLYNDKIVPRYSLIDGNSRKFYEYLALGIPIITVNVGTLGDKVKKFKCGLVLNNRSSHDLFQAILKLARDEGLWLSFSKNCKQVIEKNGLLWEHEMEKFFEAVHNLN